MEKEPTKGELLDAIQGIIQGTQSEILEAMQEFSSEVDRRFDAVDRRFEAVDKRFDRIEGRLTSVENKMVTKAYLDDKLADEGVRYGGMIRETNEKVYAMADHLVAEKSLTTSSSSRIKLMNPFPRRSIKRA